MLRCAASSLFNHQKRHTILFLKNFTCSGIFTFVSEHLIIFWTICISLLQLACRDYPHPRHLCGNFPFNSSPHEEYCDLVSPLSWGYILICWKFVPMLYLLKDLIFFGNLFSYALMHANGWCWLTQCSAIAMSVILQPLAITGAMVIQVPTIAILLIKKEGGNQWDSLSNRKTW